MGKYLWENVYNLYNLDGGYKFTDEDKRLIIEIVNSNTYNPGYRDLLKEYHGDSLTEPTDFSNSGKYNSAIKRIRCLLERHGNNSYARLANKNLTSTNPSSDSESALDFHKPFSSFEERVMSILAKRYQISSVSDFEITGELARYIQELSVNMPEKKDELIAFLRVAFGEDYINILQNFSEFENELRNSYKINIYRDYKLWNSKRKQYCNTFLDTLVVTISRRIVNSKKNADPTKSIFDIVLSPYKVDEVKKNEYKNAIVEIINNNLDPYKREWIKKVFGNNFEKRVNIDALFGKNHCLIVNELTWNDFYYIVRKIRELLSDSLHRPVDKSPIKERYLPIIDRVFKLYGGRISDRPDNRITLESFLDDTGFLSDHEKAMIQVYELVRNGKQIPPYIDRKDLFTTVGHVVYKLFTRLKRFLDTGVDTCRYVYTMDSQDNDTIDIVSEDNSSYYYGFNYEYIYRMPLDGLQNILNSIFGEVDAKIIYVVIKLNGIWNDYDFKKELGMSIDAVKDRVLKILQQHINSKCSHPQISMIYKICLNFLTDGERYLVRTREM